MKILKYLTPLLALTLVNCSAHLDGASSDLLTVNPNQVFEKPAIDGPNVVGDWQSACVQDPFTSGTRQVTLQFSSKTQFKYTNSSYSDSHCTQLTKTEVHEGLYQFEQKLSSILYVIDYNYLSGKVTYKMNGQNLEFDNDIIYISELVFGDVSVNRDLPLKKILPSSQASGSSPAPTNCTNYAGTYQMNDDYFRIDQTDCSKIVWVTLATYENPNDRPVTYLADGAPHMVSGTQITAAFNGHGQFTLRLQDDQKNDFLETFSFQKVPCGLSNPSGANYLTRDVLGNGQALPDYCQYWNNNQN